MERQVAWKRLVALSMATLIAACGGGGETKEEPDPAPAPTPQPAVDRTCSGSLDTDGKTMRYYQCGDTSLVPKAWTAGGSFITGVDTPNARRQCDFKFGNDGQLVVRAGGSSYAATIDTTHPAGLITVGFFDGAPVQSVITQDAEGRDYYVGWMRSNGLESIAASVSGPGLNIFCYATVSTSGLGGGGGTTSGNLNPPSPMPPSPTPAPAPTGNGPADLNRPFIEWSNSRNGNVVVDANNETFSFFGDSQCIYSHATQKETSNFCLSGGSSGSFAGLPFIVLAVRSTSGGCIAALATPDGRQIDIYTDNGVQTATDGRGYWEITGCTS